MTVNRKTVVIPSKTGSRDHRHSNQRVLDSLDSDSNDTLRFNGIPVVDAALLKKALKDRDLLLVPYLVYSYSTYLSLSSGLPLLELVTFEDPTLVDLDASVNCTIEPYNAEFDTSNGVAKLVTKSLGVSSRYYKDKKPRRFWVSTIPSYEDMMFEVKIDDDDQWYSIDPDTEIRASDGFTSIQLRLSLPVHSNVDDIKRGLYGIYILYK